MTPIAKKTEANLTGGLKAALARAEAAEARLAEEREEWLVSMSSIEDARQEAEALAEAAEQRAEGAERLLRAAYADLRAAEDRAIAAESRLARAMEALRETAAQSEYLHEKFAETGSGNAVLARVRTVLKEMETPPPGGDAVGKAPTALPRMQTGQPLSGN